MSGSGIRSPQILIASALLALTLAVYWPTLGHDFVNYDDGDYVLGNSAIQSGLNWPTVVWAFKTGHASNWHPLTWLSHALDCQLFGLNAGWHHLASLLLHTANALLLFYVLQLMTGAMWRSALVAALFAWHPVHVESVAWVSERKDVLSTFFWLLTMLAYARYQGKGAKFKVWYALSLSFFVLGLLSKPMVVTLPFVLLLLDYWPFNRIGNCGLRVADLKRKKSPESVWRRVSLLVIEKIPFILLALGSCVVTFLVQQKGGAVSGSITLSARVANALVSYLRYLGKIFWPVNLSVLYPHPGFWPLALVMGAAIFLIVVSVGVLLAGRKHPYLPVGWFWFVGTLVPVIGLVQVGVQSMADRYTYVPAIGLFIVVAWGVAELTEKWARREAILGASAIAILIACLIVTRVQVQYWQNGETLFRHVVQVTDKNYLAYNNLGFYLENHGNHEEAMADYEKSVQINPNYEDAQNNLGRALASKGQYAAAIEHYHTALRIKPALVEAHNNLGNALGALGRTDDAVAEYQIALQYKPDDEDAHNNLGIARAMQGRLAEAEQLLQEAVRLKPSDSGAHINLGNTFAAQHKLDDAIQQYQIALRLKPEDAQVRNNLANALAEQGKLDDARENYLMALKLNPDNPEADYNLGVLLLRQGKAEEASKRFAEALRLRPNYGDAKKQLDALSAGHSN